MADVIYPNWNRRPRRESGGRSAPVQSHALRAGGVLDRTIAEEIIPRLMLVHSERDPSILAGVHHGTPMSQAVAGQFCRDVMESDAESLALVIETLYRGGMPLQEIYLHLLEPAAAHVGELWVQDRCDFVDVTLALSRLHHVVRRLRGNLPLSPVGETGRRILLTTIPGEQHIFGVTLLSDLFRQAGWDVIEATGHSRDDLRSRLAAERVDCVGVSISGEVLLPSLAPLTSALRRASLNPAVKFLAGGGLFAGTADPHPNLGIDAVVSDARLAIAAADDLIGD